MKKFPSVQSIFILSGILAGSGFLGLLILIFATLPTLGPRWLFFFFLTLLAIGVSLPLIHFLHRRFPSEPSGEYRDPTASGDLGGSIYRPARLVAAWPCPGYGTGGFHRHRIDRDRIPAAHARTQ